MVMKVNTLIQLASRFIDTWEAEILLADALGENRAYLFAHDNERCSFWVILRFLMRAVRRVSHVPIAQIIRKKEFCGLSFYVNKHTLVPRPETELLVETALSYMHNDTLLVDVGTGSGCIPIAIARQCDRANVMIATDISSDALKVAKKNADTHGVSIDFRKGSLLSSLQHSELEGDMVVTANLPYLSQSEFDIEPSIQKEPVSALVAKENGLSLYRQLFSQLQNQACKSLAVVCECNPHQMKDMKDMIYGFFPGAKVEIKHDLAGQDRVIAFSV